MSPNLSISLGFLSGYSERFAVALALWPIASFCLTLPLIAFLYHRDGRLRLWSTVGAYLCVLYGLSLVCFTLYPLPSGNSGLGITYGVPPQLNLLAFVDDLRREGFHAVPQILANVAFFVPLGFIVGRALRLRARWAFVLGLATSLLIETAQLTGLFFIYPYAYRTFDVDDLVWNTSGAMIGWGCAAISKRLLPSAVPDTPPDTANPGLVRRTVALCLDGALIATVTLGVCAVTQIILVLCGAAQSEEWMVWVAVAAFVLFEGAVPWTRGGRTLGGDFVRMTCETRPRSGVRRVVFYLARLVTIALACLFPVPAAVILAIFYACARRMPYDYI